MADEYEITITHTPEKGGPLTQTIACDREMAISFLRAVIDELESTRDAGMRPQDDPWTMPIRANVRVRELRSVSHPMALEPGE